MGTGFPDGAGYWLLIIAFDSTGCFGEMVFSLSIRKSRLYFGTEIHNELPFASQFASLQLYLKCFVVAFPACKETFCLTSAKARMLMEVCYTIAVSTAVLGNHKDNVRCAAVE